MPGKKDPTEPIRLKAGGYSGVDEGTSCTQSSFKCGKTAFLYIGMQGGRYKAMFKLEKSRPEAEKLAKKAPDRFQTGATAWVTARFSAEEPMPKKLWEKWLDESYELSLAAGNVKKKSVNKTSARTSSKKKTSTAEKKKVAKKK